MKKITHFTFFFIFLIHSNWRTEYDPKATEHTEIASEYRYYAKSNTEHIQLQKTNTAARNSPNKCNRGLNNNHLNTNVLIFCVTFISRPTSQYWRYCFPPASSIIRDFYDYLTYFAALRSTFVFVVIRFDIFTPIHVAIKFTGVARVSASKSTSYENWLFTMTTSNIQRRVLVTAKKYTQYA